MPCATIAVFWMLFMGVVFLFPSTPDTSVADMNYTVVVLFGTLFLSLAWYYFPVYGGVHWFTGPVATIAKDQSLQVTGDEETVADDDSSSSIDKRRAAVNVSEA